MMFDKVFDGPTQLERCTVPAVHQHTLQSYSYGSNSIPALATLLAVRSTFNTRGAALANRVSHKLPCPEEFVPAKWKVGTSVGSVDSLNYRPRL